VRLAGYDPAAPPVCDRCAQRTASKVYHAFEESEDSYPSLMGTSATPEGAKALIFEYWNDQYQEEPVLSDGQPSDHAGDVFDDMLWEHASTDTIKGWVEEGELS
jgi:hypothetical protein